MSLAGFEILVTAILLILAACFASAETAVFSLRTHEIRRLERHPTARTLRVAGLLRDPHRFLVAILLGNTLVSVGASCLGTSVISHYVRRHEIAVSVVVMSLLILVFGDVVPKTYALNNPIRLSLRLSAFISFAVRLAAPVSRAFELLLNLAARRGRKGLVRKAASGEQVAEAVAIGHAQGLLDAFEGGVLRGFFKVMDLSVANIMTPRTEVFMLSEDLTVGEAKALIKSSGFSRVPVFDRDNRDNVVGVLYVKDIIFGAPAASVRLGEIARKPVFVPESKPAADLMHEFEGGFAHFAVVIDEYGTVSGIVTMDDILEEIAGRFTARRVEKYSYLRRSRSSWEVSGRMEIDYFNALVGGSVPDDVGETVAGLVISKLGRIPSPGEEVTIAGLRFRVLEADKMRVRRLVVEKLRRPGRTPGRTP